MLGFGYCLMVSWLFCFLCFTSSVSFDKFLHRGRASTSTKYGQPDMEYFETSSGCRKLRQRSFYPNECKLIHRGGRFLDTLRQHSRNIKCVSAQNHCELDFGSQNFHMFRFTRSGKGDHSMLFCHIPCHTLPLVVNHCSKHSNKPLGTP